MLNIGTSIENGKAVLALEGRLDTLTAPDFEKALKEAVPGVSELTLDFEKLEYISSAGLRVLLTAQKIMDAQGKMKLVHVCGRIMDIFELTSFVNVLTIE